MEEMILKGEDNDFKHVKALHEFAESLQHFIRPQNSVTSLYGRFRAEKHTYTLARDEPK